MTTEDGANVMEGKSAPTPVEGVETTDSIVDDGRPPVEPPVTTEPPPQTPEEQPPEDPKLSQAWLALQRKERALMQQARQMKERLRSDPDFEEFQRFKKIKEKAGEDPDELLKAFNWDYDKLIRHKMGAKEQEPSTEEKLLKRIDDLESKLSEREKTEEEEQATRKYQAAINHIEKELEAKGDDFELTILHKASGLVYDVIREHHDKTGEVLELEQAAKAVEDYLEKETEKLTQAKKVRQRFAQSEPADKTELGHEDTPAVQAKEAPTTISSQAIQSSSTVQTDDDDDAWDDERSLARIKAKWRAKAYPGQS